MKKRIIVLALLSPVVLLVGAIALLPSPDSTNAAKSVVTEKPINLLKSANPQIQKPVGPWLITLNKVTSQGPKMPDWLDDSKTHEATGQWATAYIQVKNTSQSRQSLKEIFHWTGATILDGKGIKKESDSDVTDSAKIIEFQEKPFTPGEVRTIKLSFDIPENASIQRVDLTSFKSEAGIKVLPAQ